MGARGPLGNLRNCGAFCRGGGGAMSVNGYVNNTDTRTCSIIILMQHIRSCSCCVCNL